MDFVFPGAAAPVEPHDDDRNDRAESPQQHAALPNPFVAAHQRPLAAAAAFREPEPRIDGPRTPALFSTGVPTYNSSSLHNNSISPTAEQQHYFGTSNAQASSWNHPSNTTPTPLERPTTYPMMASDATSSDAWIDVSGEGVQYKLDLIREALRMDGLDVEDHTLRNNGGTVSLRLLSAIQAQKAACKKVMQLKDGTHVLIIHASERVPVVLIPPDEQQQQLTTGMSNDTTTTESIYRFQPVVKRRTLNRSLCDRLWMWILLMDDDVETTVPGSKKEN